MLGLNTKKWLVLLSAMCLLASCASAPQRKDASVTAEVKGVDEGVVSEEGVVRVTKRAFDQIATTQPPTSPPRREPSMEPATRRAERESVTEPPKIPEKLRQPFKDLPSGHTSAGMEPSPLPKRQPKVKSSKGDETPDIVLNFESADIYEVLQVFSEILEMTYTVDPRVRGKVTIHTKSKLNREQLEAIFYTVLELNGVAAIKKNGYYEIIPLGEALKRGEITSPEIRRLKGLETGKLVIEAIHVRYVNVAEVAKLVRPFLSEGAGLYEFPLLNLLLLADDPENVVRIRSIVDALDINSFADVHFRLYTLENASVEDVGDDFKAAFESIKLMERMGQDFTFSFTPIPRINSILVVSSMPELFEKIEMVINTLDSEAHENEERVFVYRVQNSKAEDIVDVLEQIYGEGKKESSKKKSSTTTTRRATNKPGQPAPPPSPSSAAGDVGGVTTGEVKFVFDETNNAILIRATPRDYKSILKTLRELDVYPRQVLIEVLIAEITLDDSNAFGFEWTKLGAQGTGSQIGWSSGLSGSSPPITSGLVYTINYVNEFVSALRAYAAENKVNVLSSPHIIASNNQEAKIDISREVPIVTSETTTTNATTTTTGGTTTRDQNIEYRDTGIILTVTPYINDQGLVKLELNQEVSNLDTTTVVEGVNSPVFYKRVATTSLTVQDGQSVLIGGLISRENTRNRSGVPGLSKLPGVGWLFGYYEEKVTKTELMLLLTPRVIEHIEEADFVTAEFRQKVESLRSSVERSLAPENSILY